MQVRSLLLLSLGCYSLLLAVARGKPACLHGNNMPRIIFLRLAAAVCGSKLAVLGGSK